MTLVAGGTQRVNGTVITTAVCILIEKACERNILGSSSMFIVAGERSIFPFLCHCKQNKAKGQTEGENRTNPTGKNAGKMHDSSTQVVPDQFL